MAAITFLDDAAHTTLMRRLGLCVVGLMIATAMVADASLVRPAAQTSPPDHEAHHPPSTTGQAEGQPSSPPAQQPSPAPSAAPMQGAGMEQMMKEMERMMGFPPRKPIMSRLLDVDHLSERERNALRSDAGRQAQEGLTLLQDGVRELVYVARAGYGLMQSDDAAATWRPTELAAKPNEPVIAIALGPDGKVAVATTGASISVLDDGGRTWRPCSTGGVVPSARRRRRSDGLVYRKRGQRWQRIPCARWT
jgi:hypothetical protein